MRLKGLDVYHGDRPLDFHAMAEASVKYVFIKATQGVGYDDPCYLDNYERAKSVGLIAGAYHYFDPTADPAVQASHFMARASLHSGDLVHALDVETDGDGVAERAKACAQEIKTRTGRWPIIYSGDAFFQARLAGVFPEGLHTLWIARYSQSKPRTRCAFWQYTDASRIGWNPPLDSEQFFGTMDDLKQHLI